MLPTYKKNIMIVDLQSIRLTGCSGHDHTTLQSCGSIIVDNAGSTLLPSCNNATSLQSCGSVVKRNNDYSTTLQSCGASRNNDPTPTLLAHSTRDEAIRACQTWCPQQSEACKTTTISQSADLNWHWTVPTGCTIQCPTSLA